MVPAHRNIQGKECWIAVQAESKFPLLINRREISEAHQRILHARVSVNEEIRQQYTRLQRLRQVRHVSYYDTVFCGGAGFTVTFIVPSSCWVSLLSYGSIITVQSS